MVIPPLPIQRGTTLIEVLVTMVILVFGLLGLAGLQARLQVSEMESYQRAQALILLDDMVNRITANRSAALLYVTGADNPLGAGMVDGCPTDVSTVRNADVKEWCNALEGAAETSDGNKVGAMIGARGCVESTIANEYLVTVAWQGLASVSAPPASVACGYDQYAGGACTGANSDKCRRAITTVVRIGTL